MATVEEEYAKIRTSPNRPIPGQSLTNDPESPRPMNKRQSTLQFMRHLSICGNLLLSLKLM